MIPRFSLQRGKEGTARNPVQSAARGASVEILGAVSVKARPQHHSTFTAKR
jgi:hypothetical protein